MTRALAGFAAVAAMASLIVAVFAYREATTAPGYGEVAAAGFLAVKAGLTRADVRALVGTPGSVMDCRYATTVPTRICSTQNHGDKECWQYTRPYQLTVCFGPSGRAVSVGRYMGFTRRTEALSAQLAATRKQTAPRFERPPLRLRGLTTRQEVVAAIGLPDEVFRKNPRAECWAYKGPYSVRLCFGAKRRLAWWSVSIPHQTG